MTKLIIKLFIRNSNDTADPIVRQSYGNLAGIVGIISNIILFCIKVLTGIVFKSIAITADAVNNLSDAGSSVITLIGFKLSSKPADEEHPYGHARMEYIAGLIVSFIIIFLGLQLITSSVDKIIHPSDVRFSFLTVAVLIISIAIKLWQGIFNRTIGKAINSTALQAAAIDSLNDVYATSAVLVSAIIGKITGWQLDGYIGVVVAGFIIVSGVKLVIETANPLLGTAPDEDLVDVINKKIMSYDGVIGFHDLVVHNYGPERCFASVHVEVPAKQDILISHDIIDNIEHDFINYLNIHLVIHLDPVVTDDEQTNHLKLLVEKILSEVSGDISMHDFRVVIGATHTNLIFDVCIPPSYKMSSKELCQIITRKIKAIDSSYYTVITVDRSYISTVTKS